MADVFLRRDGAVSVEDGARVFGQGADGQRIFLDAATIGVRLDANIPRVDIDRRLDDLTFTVARDGLRILADGTRVATAVSLNQPTELVTRDGNVTLRQTGPQRYEITGADGAATRVDADGTVAPAVLAGPTQLERPPLAETRAATVFLDPDDRVVAREAVEVLGNRAGTGTVALAADARNLRTDANITRLEIPHAFDTIAMRVTPGGLELAKGGAPMVTLPSLNRPIDAVFADGAVRIAQVGAQRFEVVGAASTATLNPGGLDGDVMPAANPGGDGSPTVGVADAEAVEGGALAFDVTTSNLPVGAELTYTITPDSAAAADLRGALTGAVTVGASDGRATVLVETADDSADESRTETVTVAVDAAGDDAGDTATGTIRDNDDGESRDASAPVPNLAVADASAREGGTLRFNVTSTDLPAGAEIDWRVAFTGAQAADLAAATSGTVALDDGNAAIGVATTDDTLIETGAPETVELIATNRATGARATAVGEIADNDGAAAIESLTVTAPSTTEGGDLTFALLAPAASDQDRRFAWDLDLDGTPPSLVTGATSGTVTIPAGSTRADVTVATADDSTARDEPDTVTLRVGDGAGTRLAEGTGTIRDDDPAVPPDVPVLTLDDATAREGETLKIPFALSEPAPAETAIVGGVDSARAGPGVDADDFRDGRTSDVVALEAGRTNGVLNLPIADDDSVEGAETFGTSASSPDLAETDVRFGEATILDNDGTSADADPMAM